MNGPYSYSGRNDGYANARLVCNSGDIIEGVAELLLRKTWLGNTVPVPADYVITHGSKFYLDHITENGRAVYLEEWR